MATVRAIVVPEVKKATVENVPIPKLRDEWVLVRVKAIALNPSDWKHIDYGAADAGCRVGCDYAGVVEDVGSQVAKFKKGDRIAGLVHGCDRSDHESGAYGEYIIAKAALQFKIPDNISDEEASTLGVALITVGQGLYKSLELPLPDAPAKEPFPVLIHAASTATGVIGLQFAKASGLTVIATASPHNFNYLKSLGADAVFDYHSETCAADIRAFTGNKLTVAWDCMGTGARICAAAMSGAEPGTYGTINPVDDKELKATNAMVGGSRFTLGYDVFGEPYVWMGKDVQVKHDEFEFAVKFVGLSETLLAKRTIRPIQVTVNKTGPGLDGALRGLDELRAGRVSGTKLVYTL